MLVKRRGAYAVAAFIVALFWWASQHVAVPRSMGNWAARGSTPEQAAAAFARPLTEEPDISLIRTADSRATVRVYERFRGDDSIANVE